MENTVVSGKDLAEGNNFLDTEVLLQGVKLVPGSVVKPIERVFDYRDPPIFYCLLELDEESGLVLPIEVRNQYVQESRPSTYEALVRASEGKQVSARGIMKLPDLEGRIGSNPQEDGIPLHEHVYMEGYVIPAFRLLSPKTP